MWLFVSTIPEKNRQSGFPKSPDYPIVVRNPGLFVSPSMAFSCSQHGLFVFPAFSCSLAFSDQAFPAQPFRREQTRSSRRPSRDVKYVPGLFVWPFRQYVPGLFVAFWQYVPGLSVSAFSGLFVNMCLAFSSPAYSSPVPFRRLLAFSSPFSSPPSSPFLFVAPFRRLRGRADSSGRRRRTQEKKTIDVITWLKIKIGETVGSKRRIAYQAAKASLPRANKQRHETKPEGTRLPPAA